MAGVEVKTPVSELTRIIRAELAARGVVPFARFMELALYHPRLGYYESDRDRVGFQGDFYTSVSTGELFGQLLACRFARWLGELPRETAGRRIVEAGAHDGRLARDIMAWLRQHRPELFGKIQYWIIEPSPQRQQWQREKLRDFGPRIQWAADLPSITHKGASSPQPSPPGNGGEGDLPTVDQGARQDAPGKFNGILFSNELLDAMPVHRFGWDKARQEWFEWGVALDGEKFVWIKIRPPANSLEPVVQWPEELLRVLPDGYVVETCPAAEQWWREAAGVLDRGRLLTLDYGFTQEEMLNPSRTQGTLRAYLHHHASADLLMNPGEQDLTAHVNFSTIQATGENAGLKTEGYLTQTQFLTGILAEAVNDPAFEGWNSSRTRQFQTLTHPDHLGRAFKVLIQGRAVETPK
jgi:SAM-dependent MidA family methyltransferase